MPGLKLYTSNRLEALVDHLGRCLSGPAAHPLASEIVLVQSKGMEHWLSMELAKRHGICANFRFPYPIHFVQSLFHENIEDVPDPSPYEPKIMAWDIARMLPDLLDQPGFQPIRTYLAGGAGDLKLFQLADRIAGLFDQYLLFRPDMILRWEAGQDDQWQAVLWRIMAGEKGPCHRAVLFGRFLDRLRDRNAPVVGIPDRLSLFGISALPPFHLQILSALASRIEVNLFLMNPCREFWGDIVSDQAADRYLAEHRDGDLAPDSLYLEAGNSLLASMGGLGRDFFKMLTDLSAEEWADFQEPDGETILAAVQSDILNLQDRTKPADGPAREADGSIRIHSCHSPLREIEALQDYLFSIFDENPQLQPDDVIVMVPAIEEYAPFIKAVFSAAPDDSRRIPYTIADRGILRESRLIDAFMKILDLPGGRVTAPAVLDILDAEAVHRTFCLDADDFETIRHWVRETGIRWGIDGGQKRDLHLPPIAANTWRTGLDRLLLGYALPSPTGAESFEGILPYNEIEGADAEVLGRFLKFTETLFEFLAGLERRRTLPDWAAFLDEMVTAFLSDTDGAMREIQTIRQVLTELGGMETAAAFRGQVSPDVIRYWLKKNLEERGFGQGFLNGGVTFCTFLPMRSIPFKCVCLIGMNDDAYPRPSRPLGFDLMAKAPRMGDRSRRSDDRYLFLEALLSAREKLFISYCGQSLKDNSLRPPSVLVSELMDYIEAGFGKEICERLFVKHRLQAFSPEYFTGKSGLFSYSEENLRAAEAALTLKKTPTPFIAAGLGEPEDTWKEVDLEVLCLFFAHPVRFLLNRRLGLYLRDEGETLEENEPFALDGLDRYVVKQALVSGMLQGEGGEDYLAVLEGQGKLPHGAAGRFVFDTLRRQASDFAGRIGVHLIGPVREPVDATLTIGEYRLTGRLANLYRDHILHFRPAKLKAADCLKAWITHLFLNHPRTGAPVAGTILCAEDVTVAYGPVEGAEDYLRVLLGLYWEGLRKPLHFFPDTSLIYAERTAKGKSEEEALRAAGQKWDNFLYPERENPYYELCFGPADPLNREFRILAETVYGPMLRHEERIK